MKAPGCVPAGLGRTWREPLGTQGWWPLYNPRQTCTLSSRAQAHSPHPATTSYRHSLLSVHKPLFLVLISCPLSPPGRPLWPGITYPNLSPVWPSTSCPTEAPVPSLPASSRSPGPVEGNQRPNVLAPCAPGVSQTLWHIPTSSGETARGSESTSRRPEPGNSAHL